MPGSDRIVTMKMDPQIAVAATSAPAAGSVPADLIGDPGHGARAASGRQVVDGSRWIGAMLWLRWKTFSGSYSALIAASRS